MNRGRKKGSSPPAEVVPDEFRCKRSDGKQWRCSARAAEGRTMCEKHIVQSKKRAAVAASKQPATKRMKASHSDDHPKGKLFKKAAKSMPAKKTKQSESSDTETETDEDSETETETDSDSPPPASALKSSRLQASQTKEANQAKGGSSGGGNTSMSLKSIDHDRMKSRKTAASERDGDHSEKKSKDRMESKKAAASERDREHLEKNSKDRHFVDDFERKVHKKHYRSNRKKRDTTGGGERKILSDGSERKAREKIDDFERKLRFKEDPDAKESAKKTKANAQFFDRMPRNKEPLFETKVKTKVDDKGTKMPSQRTEEVVKKVRRSKDVAKKMTEEFEKNGKVKTDNFESSRKEKMHKTTIKAEDSETDEDFNIENEKDLCTKLGEKVLEKRKGNKDSKMCHQCQRNDKGTVIYCQKCDTKRFCLPCISRWYPEMTIEDFEEACPVCRENCNCKACLRMKGRSASGLEDSARATNAEQVAALRYMPSFLLPVLKTLDDQQRQEIELDAKVKGITDLEIKKSKLRTDERLYCDNCSTSIVDLYRHCSKCTYDLCLACCEDLREGNQPGGAEAGSAKYNPQEKGMQPGKQTVGNNHELLEWTVDENGSIPCPPLERGGCGFPQLSLRRLGKVNFISTLVPQVEAAVKDLSDALTLREGPCGLCMNNSNNLLGKEFGKVANRIDTQDNSIYCPSALNLGENSLMHFREHWLRGQPVIVRNVLDKTKGLSWDPMVMWQAFREKARNKFAEETKTVKAIDHLDWCEVDINSSLHATSRI